MINNLLFYLQTSDDFIFIFKPTAASLSSSRISLRRLYPRTSVPVGIKDAAGCREYTIFHSKREGVPPD